MSDELIERAKIIADATGRTIADVLEDLGDDGILNESNKEEKDLITQLKEAAELISTVQQINHEVSENTVLNGGDNKTEVTVETTLEGDIVDRAIASVHRKVTDLKKIAIIILPIFILITGGTMSNMGMFSSDEPDEEYYEYQQWGCMDSSANNYEDWANEDDGSCNYQIEGCTNDAAPNYNPEADLDDGSCDPEQQEKMLGCTDESAENYNSMAEEDDGSCTYTEPEPESCEGNASFYTVSYEWLNETNDTINLKVSWDADWSCPESYDIEVDLVLKDSNDTMLTTNTFPYETYSNDYDAKSYTITNITKPIDGYKICLTIWVKDSAGEWRMDDETNIELE